MGASFHLEGRRSWYAGSTTSRSARTSSFSSGFSGHDEDRACYDACEAAGGLFCSMCYSGMVSGQTIRTVTQSQTVGVALGGDSHLVRWSGDPPAPDAPYLDLADGRYVGTSTGYLVAGAGDPTDDGRDDVFIGGGKSGKSWIVSGPPDGSLDLSVADVAFVTSGSSRLGAGFAGGQDLDGDGWDDVILTDSYADAGATNSGTAYILSGPLSGTRSVPDGDVEIRSTTAEASLDVVVLLSDPNGDGSPGLAVGSYGSSTQGEVAVFVDVPTSTTTTSAGWVFTGPSSSYAGSSLADPGDLNGDGSSDLVIVASGNRTVYLVTDLVAGTLTSADASLTGSTVESVAGLGDTDGDGYAEVAVGTPYVDTVYLIAGSAHGSSTLDAVATAQVKTPTRVEFGTSVDACDVDGDAVTDLVVGSPDGTPSPSGAGGVWRIPGPVSGTVALSPTDTWLAGDAATSQAGTSVTCHADLDDDGRADIVVGDPTMRSGSGAWVMLGSRF